MRSKSKVPKSPKLPPKVLEARMRKALEMSDKASFMERYAIFMGKAQLVEMELKRVLVHHYEVPEEKVGRYTLGAAIHDLKKNGLRADFVAELEELNGYRIEMAHNFLASDVVGKSLIGAKYESLSEKDLRWALWTVEKVIQIHNFLSKNGILLGPYDQTPDAITKLSISKNSSQP